MSMSERPGVPMKAPELLRADLKLEVITIPVSDVERAKRFYEQLGWRLDADLANGESFRALQFTPPGSSCSVHIGKGITPATPGSAHGLLLAVTDIEAARSELMQRGIEVGEIFHRMPGEAPAAGPHAARQTYCSYAAFSDPDGNAWLLQEVSSRLPGRVEANLVQFNSRAELEAALQRTAIAHGEHEERTGTEYDPNWPRWYADYLFAELTGAPLPT
jgi:catechol 2,3-dioxygenase-like lactoylglutathione lyase family enzyme